MNERGWQSAVKYMTVEVEGLIYVVEQEIIEIASYLPQKTSTSMSSDSLRVSEQEK